jgi:hypothetical protein
VSPAKLAEQKKNQEAYNNNQTIEDKAGCFHFK